MGVAMFEFGSAPFLAGAMANFLDHTNLMDGQVQGCLLPTGGTGTIFHAKPVVIQGAWLATSYAGGGAKIDFKQFQPQMAALLRYWSSDLRTDATTGLPKWYNQLESGQDNLPLSSCASNRSSCWNATLHELVLVSADVATFLYREYQAYDLFNQKWAGEERARLHDGDGDGERLMSFTKESKRAQAMADDIKRAVNQHLWDEKSGYYIALNTSSAAIRDGTEIVRTRTDVMGFPMWSSIPTKTQAASIRSEILKKDMMSNYGVRSTSSDDPRYNNVDMIKPYSNWQGPVWVNANAVLSLGLMRYGYVEDATDIAERVVAMLANDLKSDGTWHEGYDSNSGKGLAATGFLSWDTLAASWPANVARGVDPFELSR
jgi:alpha,alpha-trehalase